MKLLDTPVRPLFGRTPRELVLLAGATTACVAALYVGAHWAVTTTFVITTAMLAARFFAARLVAIGMLGTALAAHVSLSRYGDGWTGVLRLGDHVPELVFIGLGLILLCSRDLAGRFDLAQSGAGWRINRWRDLPRLHWRMSAVLGVALGALGHFLWAAQKNAAMADGSWARWAILVICISLLLLFAGQAIGFLVSAVLGITVLVIAVPDLAAAEAYLARGAAGSPGRLFGAAPHAALPVVIAAALVTLTALPYAARLLWRSFCAR